MKGCDCAECVAAHRANARRRSAKYRLNPDVLARARTTQLAKVAVRDEFLAFYKMSRGCVDCGYRGHPRALDFDHVSGTKAFTIGGSNRENRPWNAILAEIEKCEVVCANCHRIRTFNRQRTMRTAPSSAVL